MKYDGEEGARHTSDWSQWTVEHMWRVLQAENPERTARHADAWYDVMQACAIHRDRLRSYRDQLTQRWSGLAADVYVARLDLLIEGLDQTTDAAFNTYRALRTMADAVATARESMAPLYAQWQRYEREEQDYRDQWWIVQAFRSSPVTPEEREALNRPARAIMNTASDAIFGSYLTMTPAPDFERGEFVDTGAPVDVYDSGGRLNLPTVPGLRPQTRSPQSKVLSPHSSLGSDQPVLGGATGPMGQVPSLPPWTGFAPGQSPASVVAGGVPVWLVTPPSNALQPGVIARRTAPPTMADRPAGGRAVGNPGSPFVSSPVIGSRPGASGWAPAPTVGPSGGAKRVNPAGGILTPATSQRSRRSDHSLRYLRGDDDVFKVDTDRAVAPVLEPGPIPTFNDPGPAIGLDR